MSSTLSNRFPVVTVFPFVVQEPSTFELSVGTANQDMGNVIVLMLIRVAHVGPMQNQSVIQQRAIAVRRLLQLLRQICRRRHVVPVELGIVGNGRRDVRVVRPAMETNTGAAVREQFVLRERIASTGQVACAQQGCNAGDVGLEGEGDQVVVHLDMVIEILREYPMVRSSRAQLQKPSPQGRVDVQSRELRRCTDRGLCDPWRQRSS